MPQPNIQTRLCPECANSIAVDALTCPYCKADLLRSTGPEWPERSEDLDKPKTVAESHKLPLKSKVILALGLVVFALGVYLVGGNRERSDLTPVLAQQEQSLREKDQKIQQLETELAQLRQQRQGSMDQVGELKAKLEESRKEAASVKQKLAQVNHEVERLAASRVAPATRSIARASDPVPPPSSTSSRRPSEPGVYETLRSASVYEEPSGSARVVAQMGRGTEVTVTRSVGDWLEVKSKHGKPPGFIRADDARLVRRAN